MANRKSKQVSASDASRLDFESLVNRIQNSSFVLQENARMIINRNVTVRAWLTGFYIVEYEQSGTDRAKYGAQLLNRLSKRLDNKSFGLSSLKNYRQFYLYYPDLIVPIVDYLRQNSLKSQTLSGFLEGVDNQLDIKSQTLSGLLPDMQSSKVSQDGYAMLTTDGDVVPVPQMLFNRMSYSNITLLLHVEDSTQRAFYAIEAMRGPWSYRELKRQIDSNYYIRSGWSKRPDLLAEKINDHIETASFKEEIKSPFTFEFLGLSSRDVIEESDLEQSIIDHFQDFMLELGMGFCLESRQKKMLIDNRYYKADLVFYHRILKCHCIVELKAHRLDYSDVAQLNMYIEYYRAHYMRPDDNPPVGILLCTEYGQEMVQYLSPFVDPQLFVAQYELELPNKQKITEFLMRENNMMR
jgi:predicted nuclease of restriction endonuclease-like (RecB) superfamily